MVSMSQRMRKLQTKLLAIRLGPGAVVLPKDVTRIHMHFAPHGIEGHQGPRMFWKHELVRLKYHNPGVAMTVNARGWQTAQAVMTIHFGGDNATQKSESEEAATSETSEESGTRVKRFFIKGWGSGQILKALRSATKAYPVQPTPEEKEELAKLEEQRRKSEKDSKLSQEVRARVKREKELLEQARGDLAAQAP